MKNIDYKLREAIIGNFIYNKGYIRRFIKYWGTININGIEYLRPINYYYPNIDNEDILKFLKLDKKIKDSIKDVKGVKKIWLFLNASKSSNVDNVAKDILKTKIKENVLSKHFSISVGAKYDTNINSYRENITRAVPILSANTDGTYNIADFKNSFSDWLYNGYFVSVSTLDTKTNNRFQTLFVIYAYLSGIATNPIKVVRYKYTRWITRRIFTGIDDNGDTTYSNSKKLVTDTAYKLTIDIDIKAISDAQFNLILDRIIADKDNKTLSYILSPVSTVATVTNFLWEDTYLEGTTRKQQFYNLDYNAPRYLLKVAPLLNGTVDDEGIIKLLQNSIDTGYEEKSVDPWVSFAMFVIFVAAAAITVVTGGLGAGISSAMLALSGAILMGALVVSMITFIANKVGDTEWAMASGKFLRSINPLVELANIVTLVFSTISIKQLIVSTGRTLTISSVVEAIVDFISNFLDKYLFGASSNIIARGLHFVNLVIGKLQENKLDELRSKVKRKETKLNELREQKEQLETTNPLLDSINSYTKMLHTDQSIYAEVYDRPYEPWATKYHTGNIQATTVSALWLSDS